MTHAPLVAALRATLAKPATLRAYRDLQSIAESEDDLYALGILHATNATIGADVHTCHALLDADHRSAAYYRQHEDACSSDVALFALGVHYALQAA